MFPCRDACGTWWSLRCSERATGSRRSRRRWQSPTRGAWLILAIFVAVAPSVARGDDVSRYLEERGLTALLAVHLEQQLETADPAAKSAMLDRLAAVYADLLEAATEQAMRDDLRDRAERLLAAAPTDADVDPLKLALLRGSYRQAERIAEQHRLRMASAEEKTRAVAILDEIVPELSRLRLHLQEVRERASRQLSRSSGANAVLLAGQADAALTLLNQATFLQAWAMYYSAWLGGSKESAQVAQGLFAQLLELERDPPQPEDVSVDLRGVESVARAILGYALCRSITASAPTAMTWLSLLDATNTNATVAAEVPAWRLTIYLQHGEWAQALALWNKLAVGGTSMPLAWARLAAVHALEAPAGQPDAAQLARLAVGELAARGELKQILELADRYGAAALGDSGFAMRYVKGLQLYQQARARHGSDQPSSERAAKDAYVQAALELEAAVEQNDAERYGGAAAGARELIGWCRYYAGDLAAARGWFEQAADALSGQAAASSLWMAIVCADAMLQQRSDPVLQEQLRELNERFLTSYPADPRRGRLVLRRAAAESQPSKQMVAELLTIPPESDVYVAARRRAADLLLRLARAAEGSERRELERAFLEVSMPLLDQEVRLAQDGAARAEAIAAALDRCRLVLEVALSTAPPALDDARMAMDAVASLAKISPGTTADSPELTYRRVQERLLTGDMETASSLADALMTAAPSSPWTQAAQRAAFKQAAEQWRQVAGGPARLQGWLELVVRFGTRVLEQLQSGSHEADKMAMLGARLAVAEASMALWQRGDSQRGPQALSLYLAILEERPNDAAALRAVGVLAAALGDKPRALECWRHLLAGSPPATDAWHEAKFNVLNLLADLEPARAREVMDQHRQLHPDYGPEPWRSSLKELDERLMKSQTSNAPEPDGPGSGPGGAS